MPGIPLAKVIADLRNELLTAVSEGKGKELRFKLQPVEVELSVDITWSGEVEAGVKFWVLELGSAKATREQTSGHRLKLTLDPVDSKGGEFFVRDTVDRRPD
jgi:hypothetical protein